MINQTAPKSAKVPILSRLFNLQNGIFLIVLALFIALPFVSQDRFIIVLVSQVFIMALWAMSLDLLVGYTGLISFGHAAYFGIGAYACAITLLRMVPSFWLALLFSIVLSALIAAFVGWLIVRTGGITFALLNLAFGQLLFELAWKWREMTGGDDGLGGIPSPLINIGNWLTIDTGNEITFYFLAGIVLLILYFILRRIMVSPVSAVFQAIRENEERASFIGFDVRRYKLISFVMAGTLAGIAGFLFAIFKGHVAAGLMHWSASGSVLMMLILGGVGTLVGPIVGAGVYVLAQQYLSSFTEYWMIPLGIIFVLFVMFLPAGIVGSLRNVIQRLTKRGVNQ